MSVHGTPSRLLLGGLATVLLLAVAIGQGPGEKNMFIETPAGWKAPKTAWGDPDLQGTWPINYVGSVPLERCAGGRRTPRRDSPPPCDPNKAFYTEEEFKARVEPPTGRGNRYADAIKKGDFGPAFQAGNIDPTSPQRQTSLIVDPPNGRLPGDDRGRQAAVGADAQQLGDLARTKYLTFDSEHDFDTWDRCITRGMPASMFPFRYNNGVQIIQSPGYVDPQHGDDPRGAHHSASERARRRLAGHQAVARRSHGDAGRARRSSSRRRTSRPGASMTNIGVAGSPEGNRFPTSERMKITERLTRLNDDMMLYEITTEDPVVLTRPWTARFPLKMDNGYKWWEYACIEGNRTIPDYISASRAERAAQK